MHSLQALALMQENRTASEGSLLTLIQRRPSSTDWPRSNGTAWVSHLPWALSWPRQILRFAVSLMRGLSTPSPACGGGLGRGHARYQSGAPHGGSVAGLPPQPEGERKV